MNMVPLPPTKESFPTYVLPFIVNILDINKTLKSASGYKSKYKSVRRDSDCCQKNVKYPEKGDIVPLILDDEGLGLRQTYILH